MAKRKDSAPSGTKSAIKAEEARLETPASEAKVESKPAAETKAAPGIRLAASDAKPDMGTPAMSDAAKEDAEEVTLVDPKPEFLGPALTPLEHARRNPLLNWLKSRAALVAVAAGFGALVGTMASNGIGYVVTAATTPDRIDRTEALRASVGQLAAEIASLKAAVAYGGRAEAKIAGLEQFRADVSREITGSVKPVPRPAADGWTLLRVANGRALVKGAAGSFEVAPGSTLPGLGLVQRIMQQDGAWVVQTRNGIIRAAG